MSPDVSVVPDHDQPRLFDDRFFRFACVAEPDELAMAYAIRYQVYCIERGFLSACDYPDALETDEFDARSVQILATHRSGQPAGTARLVLHSPIGFPAMRHCRFADGLEHLNDPRHPGLMSFAEISRLAISKSFRRRPGDTIYGGPPRPDPDPDIAQAGPGVLPFPTPQQTPEIMIGICRLLYQETKRRGITHWVLAMERSLYVMLKRLGFIYVPAGPEVDYFGPVRPYVSSIEAFESALHARAPQTLRNLAQGLQPELLPHQIAPPSDWCACA